MKKNMLAPEPVPGNNLHFRTKAKPRRGDTFIANMCIHVLTNPEGLAQLFHEIHIDPWR